MNHSIRLAAGKRINCCLTTTRLLLGTLNTARLPELGEAEAELLRALTRANGDPVFETSAAQRAALLQLYQQYDVTQGKPANGLLGVELGQPFLDAIYSAYDQVQVGRRLSELRDRLKAAAHEGGEGRTGGTDEQHRVEVSP